MNNSKKTMLRLALALFVLLFGIGAGLLAQRPDPVQKKQADGPNERAANLPKGALASFGRLPFANGSRIHASELSPDGKLLATSSSRSATVWNTATGQPLHRFFFDVPSWPPCRRGVVFSSDSKRFACGPDSEIPFVHDTASGKKLMQLAPDDKTFATVKTSQRQIPGTIPHPNGRVLFKIGLQEIHRWDVATGKEISSYKDFIDWRQTAISPDGRWLALRGAQVHDGFLELCDMEARQAKRIDWPWGGAPIAFTSDSRALAVNVGHSDGAKYDLYLQFVSIPELKEGKRVALPAEAAICDASIAFSKDGRHVATRRDTRHLRILDVRTGKKIWAQDEIWKALFTPDGKAILLESSRSDVISLHDLATKKTIFEVKRPVDRGLRNDGGQRGGWINDWAFSPDGRVLAVAMSGGHVLLLDAATGKERARFLSVPIERVGGLDGLYLHTTVLAFSPDGQWLAGGGDDGYLRIWEVSTRREIHRLHGHEESTQTLAFSADGRRLVSFGDGEGFLWDLRPSNENVRGSDPFSDLLSKDGPTMYRAVWTLAADSTGPALLREKIPPKRVDARPERISLLIADLSSEKFKTRNAAMRSLADLEGSARPALVGALEKNLPVETRRRIESLLDALDTPTEPALQISRAVQAMEFNRTDAARQLLQDWSAGTPGLRLTEQSRAALARHRMGSRSGK